MLSTTSWKSLRASYYGSYHGVEGSHRLQGITLTTCRLIAAADMFVVIHVLGSYQVSAQPLCPWYSTYVQEVTHLKGVDEQASAYNLGPSMYLSHCKMFSGRIMV